jgi:hypothetical protein
VAFEYPPPAKAGLEQAIRRSENKILHFRAKNSGGFRLPD